MAGALYPQGIPIYPQDKLPQLIKELEADECVFAYSDVKYETVMAISAIVNAAGANFTLLGPKSTSIKSTKPVISVCAVRTGSGKSQTSRKIIEILMDNNLKVIAVRHPMPYGDLVAQRVQRFATVEDLKKQIAQLRKWKNTSSCEARHIICRWIMKLFCDAENDPDGCDVICTEETMTFLL